MAGRKHQITIEGCYAEGYTVYLNKDILKINGAAFIDRPYEELPNIFNCFPSKMIEEGIYISDARDRSEKNNENDNLMGILIFKRNRLEKLANASVKMKERDKIIETRESSHVQIGLF